MEVLANVTLRINFAIYKYIKSTYCVPKTYTYVSFMSRICQYVNDASIKLEKENKMTDYVPGFQNAMYGFWPKGML